MSCYQYVCFPQVNMFGRNLYNTIMTIYYYRCFYLQLL